MINHITRLTNERGTHIQVFYSNGKVFRYSNYHMPNKKIPKTVLAIMNNAPYETKDTEFGKVEYFR